MLFFIIIKLYFYTCYCIIYVKFEVNNMIGRDLNLAFNLNVIYDNASFTVQDNDKVGIVGVNGAGKTTLFKVILKEQELDSGKLITKDKRIGYLPQEIIIDDENITVFDYLLSARPIKKLEDELQSLYEKVAISDDNQDKIMKRINYVQNRLDYYEAYSYESILLSLIDNMNIDLDLLDMRLKDLSGGQKSKIAFARVLYSKPEILLLDEPTNHLDKDTWTFVVNYLRKYKGMVLIISHDTNFLNSVVNKIMYINKSNHKIFMYDGNYDVYKKKLELENELRNRLIEEQEKEIRKLEKFVERANAASRTNHSLKRMGKDREKKLERKLEERVMRDKLYGKVKLNITPNKIGPRVPLVIDNLYFNYLNKELLYNNLSFLINRGERFLILGVNGVGKSTLLKLIMGYLTPNSGNISLGREVEVAYYAQELELLDSDKNILENVDNPSYGEKELRDILGSFLFKGDDVFKKVDVLSPGEKARVALCKIMLTKANLLLLDEPTNHLDPETQKIIGDNFRDYSGTIIMVSHNAEFIKSVGIDRILLLPSGKIINFDEELLASYGESK